MKDTLYRINIEGADGTGKTTLAQAYRNYLASLYSKANKDVHVSYEHLPTNYNTPTGSLIHSYLNGYLFGDATEVNPVVSSLLYTIDRYYNECERKKEGIDNRVIVSDRSYISNLLYQCAKEINHCNIIRKEIMDIISRYVKIFSEIEPRSIMRDKNINIYVKFKNGANTLASKANKDNHEANEEYMNIVSYMHNYLPVNEYSVTHGISLNNVNPVAYYGKAGSDYIELLTTNGYGIDIVELDYCDPNSDDIYDTTNDNVAKIHEVVKFYIPELKELD